MKRSAIYSLSMFTVLSACQAPAPGPEDTAKSFVEAVSSGNPQAVKLFITQDSPALMMLGSQVYTGPAQAGKAAVDKHGPVTSIVPKIQAGQKGFGNPSNCLG